jgi:hypothetical protein
MVYIRDQRFSPQPNETPYMMALRDHVEETQPYRSNSIMFKAQLPQTLNRVDTWAPFLAVMALAAFMYF